MSEQAIQTENAIVNGVTVDRVMDVIGAIEDRTFSGTLEYISPKGELRDGAVQFQIKAAMDPVRIRPVPTPKTSRTCASIQLSKAAKGIRTPMATTIPGTA